MKLFATSTRIMYVAFVMMDIGSLSGCTKEAVDPERHKPKDVHINRQVPKPVKTIINSSDEGQPAIEPQPRKIRY